MFNPTLIVIEAFIGELRTMYERTYGILEPNYPGILNFAAQLALENIATSDAAYHDVDHTIMVTLVAFSPRLVEAHEPVCVQAFRPELAVEGLR